MNTEFSRIITLLRKEKKLSQKKVAVDLGISQALLSHYEKGIRECGLDFIIKTADYYNVSCDYLLGRTTERNGAKITIDDYTEEPNGNYGSMLSQLNKKLLQNSTNLIFEIAEQTNSKEVELAVSDYLMTSAYKMFRILYTANSKNPTALFSVSPKVVDGYSSAYLFKKEAEIISTVNSVSTNGESAEKVCTPQLSQDIINENYPNYSTCILNLIRIVENNIKPTK